METAIGTTKAGRILLSGASGMVGAALQTWMRADGAEIVQLVRREPEQIGELRWDPSGESGFAGAETLVGLAAAIHLSGANVAGHRWAPEYRRESAAGRGK